MKEWLQNLFFSPNDKDPSYVRILRITLSMVTAAIFAITLFVAIRGNRSSTSIILGVMALLALGATTLSFRNILWPGKLLIPSALLIGITLIAMSALGMHDASMAGFSAIIIIAGLVIGKEAIPLTTVLAVLGISTVFYWDIAGLNTSLVATSTWWDDWAAFVMIQVVVGVALNAHMGRLYQALRKSQENEHAQSVANQELRELQSTLESRIAERTASLEQHSSELEMASKRSERRARQFRAVAQVAHTISSIQDINSLLPRITSVISEQFKFYHVGIFLTDKAQEYVTLTTSSSEGGQRMIERGYKLKVDQNSIVGFVAAIGQARIALDVEDHAIFNNPDLPEACSEMAIPLRVGGEIIGVLDVQSDKSSAFDEEDVELLTIAADQVSIAIQNATQFQEAQQAIASAETTYRQYVRQEWRSLVREEKRLGFRYSKAGVGPLKAPVHSLEIEKVTNTGKPRTSEDGAQSQIVIPIKLRGEVIGVLNVKAEGQRKWDPDEVDISEAVAERVALAIENARLLESSQSQASRERTISEVTSRIGASVNMRNVLQTAVEELGRILPGSDVIIQLGGNTNGSDQ